MIHLNERGIIWEEQRMQGKSGPTTLDQCLKLYHEREKLGKNDEWYCSKCKKMQQAYKTINLWKTPKILVIHLKRFNNWEKIEKLVDFPVRDLDLSNYVLSESEKQHRPPIYDLYAVSEHMGGTMGGHYIAHGLNHTNNTWYCFDDSSVHPASPQDAVTSKAYVLFYVRRDEGVSEDFVAKQEIQDVSVAASSTSSTFSTSASSTSNTPTTTDVTTTTTDTNTNTTTTTTTNTTTNTLENVPPSKVLEDA